MFIRNSRVLHVAISLGQTVVNLVTSIFGLDLIVGAKCCCCYTLMVIFTPKARCLILLGRTPVLYTVGATFYTFKNINSNVWAVYSVRAARDFFFNFAKVSYFFSLFL